ncbi:MAG: type IV pilus assembly protein PilM [Patescibacteria group bacterium]
MDFSLGGLSEKLRQFTSSLGVKDGLSVLGVDIGTSSIKIVQVKEVRGSAVLETYGEIALGPYANAEVGQAVSPSSEKIGEALKDVLHEANATAKAGGFSVPLSGSLINVISLPTKDPNDLANMIPIEARKYIPVPISEVALDWFVIPDEEAKFLSPQGGAGKTANSTEVLLVAIHNQVLAKYQLITEAATLTPRFFEVEPFSMGRASYEHTTAPAMIIDMGASSTRVYIIEFGIIDVSHTIGRGGQDLTLALAKSTGATFQEAENIKRDKGLADSEAGSAALDFVFAEARRILLTYQRKEGKAVSQVVLVGGGAALKGIKEMAAKSFDARIIVASPFEKLATPAFIGDVLKGAGPSFASAIGLALRALHQ